MARISQAAVVGIFVAVLGAGGVWFVQKYFGIEEHALAMRLWPQSTADRAAKRELHRVAGWFSLDCGHVRHHEDAGRAIACAQNAIRTGQRFYVAFDWIGMDSKGTTGLAANSKGLYEVDTEGFRYGGSIAPTEEVMVGVTRCEKSPIETTSNRGDRVLTCLLEPSDEEGPGPIW